MRVIGRCAITTLVLCMVLAGIPPTGDSTTTPPPIEAIGVPGGGVYGGEGHRWSPDATAADGGVAVEIRSPSTVVPHGVQWITGEPMPDCTGVPESGSAKTAGTNWQGTCTFSQAGTYTFYCTVHGPEMTATVTVSIPGAPSISIGAADDLGESAATLHGSVDPRSSATEYHFNYGPSTSYGFSTPSQSAGSGSGAVDESVPLTSLQPDTTYHFQLVASNSAGTTFSPDRTFTTSQRVLAPTARTEPASGVSETQATLSGSVNPGGASTTYFFEWGTDTTYAHTTPTLSAGEDHSTHTVSAALSGLSPATVYHYRLIARSSIAMTDGSDATFTTGALTNEHPASGSRAPLGDELLAGAATTEPNLAPTVSSSVARAVGGPLLRSLRLAVRQHGFAVHGSLLMASTAAGWALRIDLLARVAGHRLAVGRLVRVALTVRRLSFAVPLSARARRLLRVRSRLRLPLTAVLTLTSADGSMQRLSRNIVLRR